MKFSLRSQTHELVHFVLWFIASVSASGAVWFYRSVGDAAGYWESVVITLVCGIAATCLQLRNARLAQRRKNAGAVIYVPYLPYGTGISRILYIANAGPVHGDVEVDVFHAGQRHPSVPLGGMASHGVTELTGCINMAVARAGVTDGKVAVTIRTSVPFDDVEVHSAYNVGGESRLQVPNFKRPLSDEQWREVELRRSRWPARRYKARMIWTRLRQRLRGGGPDR